MRITLKFLLGKFFFIILYINQSFLVNSHIFAANQSRKVDNLSKIDKNLSKEPFNNGNEYILGSGDILNLNFETAGIFSGLYSINPEGYLTLPELKKIYVNGLTIIELEMLLNNLYSEYIIDPKIIINISDYRPVRIYLSGEIKNPGLYTLEYSVTNKENIAGSFNNKQLNLPSNQESSISAPRLYEVLQLGRGLTNFADLSKVTVIRKNARANGGGKIKTEINLFDLILNGDQTRNIRIMDGDNIIVPTNPNPVKDQILSVFKTNLNPNTVTVYMTGNVKKVGPLTLNKGAGLLQAIASSGGKKLWTGEIEFIRFNDNGTTRKETFAYNSKAILNTKKNPILMDGDIVNVRKTILGNTTEILGEFSRPIFSGFALFKLFEE